MTIPAPEIIELAAGEIAAELGRRGIGADDRVTLALGLSGRPSS